jgi:hypothetical protein
MNASTPSAAAGRAPAVPTASIGHAPVCSFSGDKLGNKDQKLRYVSRWKTGLRQPAMAGKPLPNFGRGPGAMSGADCRVPIPSFDAMSATRVFADAPLIVPHTQPMVANPDYGMIRAEGRS